MQMRIFFKNTGISSLIMKILSLYPENHKVPAAYVTEAKPPENYSHWIKWINFDFASYYVKVKLCNWPKHDVCTL